MIFFQYSGYKYSYPFLDENVGIHVHDSYVEPLYMHVLNTQHRSMAFIGVTYGGVHFPIYDLQVNCNFFDSIRNFRKSFLKIK